MRRVLLALILWSAFAGPATASTITKVVVTIGSNVWSDTTVGWGLPLNLAPGEDVVFTQNGVFNFDTSDALDSDRHHTPRIDITMDGVTTTFLDTGGILNVRGLDPVTNDANEAQEFAPCLNGPGYQLCLGYADNLHTGPCGAWASSVGLNGASNCLPSPFLSPTYFYGAGAAMTDGLVQTLPDHCKGPDDCFDGPALRIIAGDRGRDVSPVPEPSSLALLGIGLLAAVRMVRRRA